MSKQNKQMGNLIKKAQSYLKVNETLLRKYNLVSQPVINFPRRKKFPLASRIALWIVAKQGGQLDVRFGDIRKK